MEAWFNNPCATIVAHFEYRFQLHDILDHGAFSQIAISNSSEQWIVLLSSMSHHMSTLEYFEKPKSCSETHRGGQNTYHGILYLGQFDKHYGTTDEKEEKEWQKFGCGRSMPLIELMYRL